METQRKRLVGSGVLLGLAGAQRAEWQQPSCYYHSVVAAGAVGHLGCGRGEVNLCQVRPSLVSAQQAPNPEQSSCMTAWCGAPRSATPHSAPPALGPAWPGKALSLGLTPNKYQEPLPLCARPDLGARDFQVTGPHSLEPTFLEKEESRSQVNMYMCALVSDCGECRGTSEAKREAAEVEETPAADQTEGGASMSGQERSVQVQELASAKTLRQRRLQS